MTLITIDKYGIGDGEADLRVNGKKMELTSLPANEWSQVVKDSEQFWDETSKISPRAKKLLMHLNYMQQQWKKLDILTDNNLT